MKGGFNGGACYDFKKNAVLVDTKFVENAVKVSGLPVDNMLEGIYAHEIGHYMVFPGSGGFFSLQRT